MSKVKLPDAQWQKIFEFLQQQEEIHLGKASTCRQFVEAVLWILRSGAPWRLLPAEYGHWNSVYQRFRRWGRRRIREKMLAFFSDAADVNTLMGDSTIMRAHAGAAGAPTFGQALSPNQVMGRSRGGFSTKIHFLVNGFGQPLRALLTPGQAPMPRRSRCFSIN